MTSFGAPQARDRDRDLVADADLDVVLEPVIRLVHDLVHCVGRGIGACCKRTFDLAQPIIERFLRPRVQRRERADDPALHCSITSFGLPAMNIGAPITGMRRRCRTGGETCARERIMARLARAPHSRTLNTLTVFAGCVAIWGTTWLAITYQLGSVAIEASVAYRFLLAAALLTAYCKLRRLPMGFTVAEHAILALLGFLMYSIGYLFVYRAEMHVASGLVAIGYSASPLLAMFGMRIAFGQAMNARMMLGSLLGIAGRRPRLLARAR
jgi:hypothetical protein